MLKVQGLDHVAITTRDPDKSIKFYCEIFGMTPAFDYTGDLIMLRAGETYLAIARWGKGKEITPQAAISVDHISFRVDAKTFELAKSELPKRGIKIDHLSDHGVSQGLYFRDPDNHLVELACYEIQGAKERMPQIL